MTLRTGEPSNVGWLACIGEAEYCAPTIDIWTASSLGDTEVVAAATGRDPGLPLRRNTLGWSPLMFAVWHGHDVLVQHLLHAAQRAGQDALQPAAGRLPRSGRTLLMVAARFGYTPIVRILCNNNSVKARDFRGQTALIHAVRGASEDVVRFLIAEGADINAIDNHGHTPLRVAEHYGFGSLERLLIEAGAEIDPPPNLQREMCNSPAPKKSIVEELEHVLAGLSLEKYLPMFRRHNVDFQTFLSLSEDDLRQIGILLLGPRRKIALEIERLRTLFGTTDQHIDF